MSHVIGVDLSSFGIELVGIDETTNQCFWDHIHLEGPNALERLRDVPRRMPRWANGWWDTCYLVAIEAPYGRLEAGTQAKLNRVFGAITTCIPPRLEVWEVMPGAWRQEAGLAGNAKKNECAARAVQLGAHPDWKDQNAYDAYLVAMFARNVNARAIQAA